MSSAVVTANKRKVFSEGDGVTASADAKRAALANSDSDDDEDRLRRSRMKEVMLQQTMSLHATAQHPQFPSSSHGSDSTASAPCTHSCPRCCPRVSSSARRITFPFFDGEWLLRPVGGRVAHTPFPRTAASNHLPAALPTSYESSIATVARSRLQSYLSKQVDFEHHTWADTTDELRRTDADDAMDWAQLLAGTARPSAEQSDSTQPPTAAEAEVVDAVLTSRERRKLKRKQERESVPAAQHSPPPNDT